MMEIQPFVTSPQRLPNGHFAPGVSGDKAYKPYTQIVRMLQDKYSSAEIIRLADSTEVDDWPAAHTMAVRQLARALSNIKAETCADVRSERETLLDRTEGKAVQAVDLNATIGFQSLVETLYTVVDATAVLTVDDII